MHNEYRLQGSPLLRPPALDRLAASPDHVISAIYTRPDAHAGRGNKMQPTRVKMRAEELGLPVFTPYSLRESGVVEHLASLAPDVIIVAAFVRCSRARFSTSRVLAA